MDLKPAHKSDVGMNLWIKVPRQYVCCKNPFRFFKEMPRNYSLVVLFSENQDYYNVNQ